MVCMFPSIKLYTKFKDCGFLIVAEFETSIGSLCIVKNCDPRLENAALGLWSWTAFLSLGSQFFTIWTNPKLVNNKFKIIFFPAVS